MASSPGRHNPHSTQKWLNAAIDDLTTVFTIYASLRSGLANISVDQRFKTISSIQAAALDKLAPGLAASASALLMTVGELDLPAALGAVGVRAAQSSISLGHCGGDEPDIVWSRMMADVTSAATSYEPWENALRQTPLERAQSPTASPISENLSLDLASAISSLDRAINQARSALAIIIPQAASGIGQESTNSGNADWVTGVIHALASSQRAAGRAAGSIASYIDDAPSWRPYLMAQRPSDLMPASNQWRTAQSSMGRGLRLTALGCCVKALRLSDTAEPAWLTTLRAGRSDPTSVAVIERVTETVYGRLLAEMRPAGRTVASPVAVSPPNSRASVRS